MMKKFFMGLFATWALLAVTQAAQAGSLGFSDIQYWVGTGSNQAALVIDWNDGLGLESMVWGYRWDGEATGQDMFFAVAEADNHLYAKVSSVNGKDINGNDIGVSLYGIGYDLNNDGRFSINDSSVFDAQGITTGAVEEYFTPAVSNDAGDHYKEGWLTGFWNYWLGDGNPYGDGSWNLSDVGMTSHTLFNGDWNGFSFDQDYSSFDPLTRTEDDAPGLAIAAPVPTPEPGALAMSLVLIAALATAWRVRRRKGD